MLLSIKLLLLKFNSVQLCLRNNAHFSREMRQQSSITSFCVMWYNGILFVTVLNRRHTETQPGCPSHYSNLILMLKLLITERTQMDVWKGIHNLPPSSILSSVCLMTHVRVGGSSSKIDLLMPASSSYKFIKLQSSGIVKLSYVSLIFSASHRPSASVVSGVIFHA